MRRRAALAFYKHEEKGKHFAFMIASKSLKIA
jgi:hypothetical protein